MTFDLPLQLASVTVSGNSWLPANRTNQIIYSNSFERSCARVFMYKIMAHLVHFLLLFFVQRGATVTAHGVCLVNNHMIHMI